MSRIIIGIHGLANKPPRRLLEKWWKKSIREGLGRIGVRRRRFRFELVYWADILHPLPQDPAIRNPEHPRYLADPYMPDRGIRPLFFKTGIQKKWVDLFGSRMEKLLVTEELRPKLPAVQDLVIRRYFKDLDAYFGNRKVAPVNGRTAKQRIQERLALMLKKHGKKKIMLIAHSMGSIIAYDVLTDGSGGLHVDRLVTIGSPLGQPAILSKIAALSRKTRKSGNKLKTPGNIRESWHNLSDLNDKVAIHFELAEHFTENAKHIMPEDRIVRNEYTVRGKKSPHKIYGYLRTPEMAGLINDFLGSPLAVRMTRKLGALLRIRKRRT
ncbi:hypothetical protein JW906_04990 [bacterium]|nr:hypothetical protein [bacterium]